MRTLLRIYIFLLPLSSLAQDKIYLLNGECINGKVLEISPDFIRMESDGTKTEIQQQKVLLIEFKNGSIELINSPENNAVKKTNEKQSQRISNNSEVFSRNLMSINTLALCNADVAGFYEKILKNKTVGLGLMAAYNFNSRSSVSNLFITALGNAKKNYDIGFYANVYPGRFQNKTTMSFGILVKYTDFIFTKQTLTPNSITYAPAKGSQLATIVCVGTHTKVKKNFFIKTIFGLGGFGLKGVYQEQFNSQWNSQSGGSGNPVNYSFLPKAYLGINAGFNF